MTVLAGLLAAACGGLDPLAHGPGASAKAEGGEPDVDLARRFPATVFLPDCTGAKIGPRAFLTAAHCVTVDDAPALRPGYVPGELLELLTGADLAAEPQAHPCRVTEVLVHPSYALALEAAAGRPIAKSEYAHVFDLALVLVDADTPRISAATTDRRPLVDRRWLGDRPAIQVGGYGQQGAVPGLWDGGTALARDDQSDDLGQRGESAGPTNRLRYRRTEVHDSQLKVHRFANGRWVEGRGWVVDNGFGAGEEIRLRPGDSGGPVYLDLGDPTQPLSRVVGVNSFAGPSYSSFVRLDLPRASECLATALGSGPAARDHLEGLALMCAPARER